MPSKLSRDRSCVAALTIMRRVRPIRCERFETPRLGPSEGDRPSARPTAGARHHQGDDYHRQGLLGQRHVDGHERATRICSRTPASARSPHRARPPAPASGRPHRSRDEGRTQVQWGASREGAPSRAAAGGQPTRRGSRQDPCAQGNSEGAVRGNRSSWRRLDRWPLLSSRGTQEGPLGPGGPSSRRGGRREISRGR